MLRTVLTSFSLAGSCAVVCGLLATFRTSEAIAQSSSTNCIAMGTGMVHCDTMSMGGTGLSDHDGGAALGRGIGELISRGRENAFRKRIGQMLANGDCEGAVRFATEKGRLELAATIVQSCRYAPAEISRPTVSVSQMPSASAIPPGSKLSQSTAFNLLCNGTETLFAKAGASKEAPYSRIFRIDLNSRRYCDGDCTTTRPIARIESTRITLFESNGPAGWSSDQELNRESGDLTTIYQNPAQTKVIFAKCERQSFAGFPEPKF